MKKRLFVSTLLVSLVLISLVANVAAITGRMGNSRMVLNFEVGEEIRRHILVQNVNDVPLTIEFQPSGDLADNVELEEESFVLQPGEEKNAYFTISADEAGTTETKINVLFKPPQGSGVGLSATIVAIAGGESENPEDNQDEENPQDQEDSEDEQPDASPDQDEQQSNGMSFSPITILTASSAILIIAFIVLLAYSGKKLNRKKRSRRPRE